MTDNIVTVDHIIGMARRDHAAGKSRDDHGFNWHALCLPTYLAEFDRLESQQSHGAPAGRARVEQAQAHPQIQGA